MLDMFRIVECLPENAPSEPKNRYPWPEVVQHMSSPTRRSVLRSAAGLAVVGPAGVSAVTTAGEMTPTETVTDTTETDSS
jgi:hypothetical protein